LRLLTLPLCGIGLLLALLGLLAADPRRSGYLLPAVGLLVNGPILVYAVFGMGLLTRAPRADEAARDAARPAVVPLGSRAGSAFTPAGDAEWIDAASGAVQLGDARVRVRAVEVGPVEFKDGPRKRVSKEKYLQITLRLNNVGVAQKLTYTSWAGANPATLRDQAGRVCRARTFAQGLEVVGHVPKATLAPGKFTDDVLVFEPPAAGVEYLRLELPAAAFGGNGALRLQIPRSMITFR
jgi:hypothetical protein